MTDDRCVSQQEQRLGDQRSECGQGQPEDLVISRMPAKQRGSGWAGWPRKHGWTDATVE